MATWDPAQYEQFSDLRNRPFFDLTDRISVESPASVADLGCGNGPLTLALADRWPQAHIVGLDSSASMLDRARALDSADRVDWQLHDVADWSPERFPEVLVSNATLQWVPGHLELLTGWLRRLPDGGWLAMQVPGNFDAPSHRIIGELAREHGRSEALVGALRSQPVASPQEYAETLAVSCGHVDVWETTYLQILDPAHEQRSPVLEWVKGTALRPLLDVLEPQEQQPFLAELERRFAIAYPTFDYGTPMPFRRIFAVGRKGGRA